MSTSRKPGEGGTKECTHRAMLHDNVALFARALDHVVVEADDEGVTKVLEDVHLARGGGQVQDEDKS